MLYSQWCEISAMPHLHCNEHYGFWLEEKKNAFSKFLHLDSSRFVFLDDLHE